MPSSASIRMNAATDALGHAPVGRLLARFAVPSITAMLVMTLYNIVDQIFIGWGVGYIGNAATNVVFPITVFTIAFVMLLGDGSGALYSIKLGEGDRESARQTVANGLMLLAVVAVVFATLCFLFLHPLLEFFGASEAVLPYARDYAGWIVFGVPFLLGGAGINAITRADARPGYAMQAVVIGAVLNTILDPVFIFWLDMGVRGAALATAISQFATFVWAARYLLRPDGLGLRRHHFVWDMALCRRILACGCPLSLSQTTVMVVIILLNQSLSHYGALSKYGAEIPLAAHGICMKVNQILFSVMVGMSMGIQPIVGYNFGARQYGRVLRTYYTAVGVTVGFGVLATLVFELTPQTIINLFGHESALYNEFARRCFRVFLALTATVGFTLLSGGFFQSMARVRPALIIQLARQLVCIIPAILILPRLWGIDGILLCGPTGDGLSCLLAGVMIIREVRRLRRLQDGEPYPGR